MRGLIALFHMTLQHVGYSEGQGPVRDLDKFPVCLTDNDCLKVSGASGEDYRCFQYMCFPWKSDTKSLPFKTCKKSTDCSDTEDCYRHNDRRKVFSGICLSKEEMPKCFEHSECGKGLKCVNGYCGDERYFSTLKDTPCTEDFFCQVQKVYVYLPV